MKNLNLNLLRILSLAFVFGFVISCNDDDGDYPPFSPTATWAIEINGADPLTVSFSTTTTNALLYEWDFGDGNTSNEVNPTYTYNDYGDYSVSLTVNGEEGSTPVVLKETISLKPAVFSPLAVENGDFELPATGRLFDWENVPGWNSDEIAGDSGVEFRSNISADGSWTGVLRNVDPSAWNLTDHVISEGEEFKMTANVADIWNSPLFIVTLYYDTGDGVRNVLGTETFDVIAGQANSIEFIAAATEASIGAKLGIEIRNDSGNPDWGWLEVDNVQLYAR